MDIAKIKVAPGEIEWSRIEANRKKGRPIDKQEVLRLLRSGVPVPSYAAEMLADALDADVKFEFKRGNKNTYSGSHMFDHDPLFISRQVRIFEGWIKNPASMPDDYDSEYRKEFELYHARAISRYRNDKIKPNVKAVELVAEMRNLSVRKVRTKMTEYNKWAKKIADEKGFSVKEVKDYFLK